MAKKGSVFDLSVKVQSFMCVWQIYTYTYLLFWLMNFSFAPTILALGVQLLTTFLSAILVKYSL